MKVGTIMSKMLTRELTGAYLSYKVAEAMGHVRCVVNLQDKCIKAYVKNVGWVSNPQNKCVQSYAKMVWHNTQRDWLQQQTKRLTTAPAKPATSCAWWLFLKIIELSHVTLKGRSGGPVL